MNSVLQAPADVVVPSAQSVGEVFLAVLKQKGIDFLFINSGTDSAPIVEAYARHAESGLDYPLPIIGTHENVVVSMAHGYTMMTGKPQAVMVHVTVGAANSVCAVMNARRDEIPMLFMAGRTPLYEKGVLGARNGAIHWAQEMYDQGGMLRELVKWDYELRGSINLDEVVDRALSVSQASPAGPVYLTLPREVLSEQTVATVVRSTPATVPTRPAPDRAGALALARMISQARCPVLATVASGRDPATVVPLERFCEKHGVGVIEAKSRYVCARASHPYHLGQNIHPILPHVDLLICLETDVPWIPGIAEPSAATRIAHIGVDPLFQDFPIRSFRSDLSITSSAAAILPVLEELLTEIDAPGAAGRRKEQADLLAKERLHRRAKRLAALIDAPRMTKDWLNFNLNRALGEDTVLINEYWADREIIDLERPQSYFLHSSAAGLGWGLPAAVGASLAAPDKVVVVTLGDGAYIFGNPAASHHAAALHNAPFLTIICNNARWNAVQLSTFSVFPKGHAVRGPRPAPLSDLHPVPDFERYVEASGGYGERVTDPAKVLDAMQRGLEIVRRERRQVLLNMICE